jgi:hypothetical protein
MNQADLSPRRAALPFFIWVAGAARISCTWPPSYIEGEFKFFQQAIDQVLSKNDKKKERLLWLI